LGGGGDVVVRVEVVMLRTVKLGQSLSTGSEKGRFQLRKVERSRNIEK
jgi:hypothetical protein